MAKLKTGTTIGGSIVWHQSNDGTGSGLDADLLDGLQGSYYLDWTNVLNKPDPVLTLSGDVSGTATFTDLGNANLTVTIADDSHNHTIANVDGLQTALNGKVDDSQVLTNVPLGALFTDTVYTHPSYSGDDFSVDTGPLTGAVVVSDIDINVTTDTLGHVTDANGVVSTRTLTLGDLGYTGATNANNYVLPEATATSRGGIEIFSNTDQTVGANAVSATAGRTYGIQLNAAGQAVVNVPWVDTNTNTWRPIHDTPVDGATTTSISSNWAFDNVKTAVPAGAVFTDTVYSLPEATTTTRGGIELFSNTDQTVAANAVSATAGRTYGLQLNSAGQAVVNVPWSDTNTVYTHPSHPGDDISIDTGPLSGATVISDLDFNVTTDTLGHVTDANATISTRNLTAANIGAAPASHNHDDRYYTETESDSRFVNVTGDSMSGNLSGSLNSSLTGFILPQNPEGQHIKSPFFFNDIAFARLRGATVSVDIDGTPMTSTSAIDSMLNTSGDFWGMSTSGVSTVTITITSLPKGLNYGAFMGLTFGNPTWRAKGIILEYSTDGGTTWTTARSTTTNSAEFYVDSFSSGATATNALRWTLSDFNTTSLRVASLFAYNYNSSGMKGLYVSRDGGEVYGSLGLTGGITVAGGINGLTLANGISGTNFNITGVNQLQIADPGEGILFTGGASGNINLAIVDDASDNRLDLSGTNATMSINDQRVFADDYHPNADKWTTARTNTVALSGDVTGSGSASVDGSGNWTVSVPVTVSNNSHNHTTLTGVTSIGFNAQSTDSASISTTINGTSTYFDFNLTDDNNTDWWRWRFTPSGSAVYDAMVLKPTSNGNANLIVSGSITADSFSGSINYNQITNPPADVDNYVDSLAFNTSNGVLTLGRTGSLSNLTVDLDGRYQSTLLAPVAPSITSTSIVDDTIEVVFSQSSTSGVESYEVWSDLGIGSYSLIAKITDEDFAASMSVIDTTFKAGTVNYRVFAIKHGVYSSAATTSRVFTSPSLDVTSLQVLPDLNVFYIGYNIPESRFVDHVEIYVDTNASSSGLARANASLIYSGNNSNYTYNISASERDAFHQFWVEVL